MRLASFTRRTIFISTAASIFAPALALALVGCSEAPAISSATDAGVDLAMAPPDLFMPDLAPRPHPMLPQLEAHSGVVFSSVKLVTVTFMDTVYQSEAEDFGDFVVGSQWLETVGGEYGVHAGRHLKKVQLPMKSPTSITDGGLVQFLKSKIMDMTLPAPAADDQILYMVYFPPGITITHGVSTLCNQFAGYHNYSTYNGNKFTYAAIGDCNQGPEQVTITASHELIETATDPYLNSYSLDVAGDDPWQIENGQEDGDMCEYEPDSVHEKGFALQKNWSNKAAAAGGDPCIPEAPATYYNVMILPEGVPEVAAGGSITFTITGWTKGNLQPWKLSIANGDNADFDVTQQQAVLSGTTIYNNASVTLTLRPPADATSGLLGGVLVRSADANHSWPVTYTVK